MLNSTGIVRLLGLSAGPEITGHCLMMLDLNHIMPLLQHPLMSLPSAVRILCILLRLPMSPETFGKCLVKWHDPLIL